MHSTSMSSTKWIRQMQQTPAGRFLVGHCLAAFLFRASLLLTALIRARTSALHLVTRGIFKLAHEWFARNRARMRDLQAIAYREASEIYFQRPRRVPSRICVYCSEGSS